jgi:predicted signal transduction protein with EAL and GGDEF domain
LQGIDAVSATLAELNAMGVTCSVDDFGTGYSGLSYLSRFPLSALKIDKSFVQAIPEERAITGDNRDSVVSAIIALAHGLHLTVIAEGVETQGQLYSLLRAGCDQMQGFLFSPPVPAEQFESLVVLERITPGPGRLSFLGPSEPGPTIGSGRRGGQFAETLVASGDGRGPRVVGFDSAVVPGPAARAGGG